MTRSRPRIGGSGRRIRLRSALAFAPPPLLLTRYMEEAHRSAAEARAGFFEVKKFLVACACNRTGGPLAPSALIDPLWHAFVLFTREYGRFCELLGGYLHHSPTESALQGGRSRELERTVRALLATFGDIDPTWWSDALYFHWIAEALEADPPAVRPAELQAAANRFRRARGLLGSAETLRWLRQAGLTREQFVDHLTWEVQLRTLRARIARGRERACFAARPARFDHIRMLQVTLPAAADPSRLARDASSSGLAAATGIFLARSAGARVESAVVETRMHRLPADCAPDRGRCLVGPYTDDTGVWLGEVLERRPATWGPAAREAVRDLLFEEWLKEQGRALVAPSRTGEAQL